MELHQHDDANLRFSAYVVMCLFVTWFDVPDKMMISTLKTLLKSYLSESRFLVRQSLEILLPMLP